MARADGKFCDCAHSGCGRHVPTRLWFRSCAYGNLVHSCAVCGNAYAHTLSFVHCRSCCVYDCMVRIICAVSKSAYCNVSEPNRRSTWARIQRGAGRDCNWCGWLVWSWSWIWHAKSIEIFARKPDRFYFRGDCRGAWIFWRHAFARCVLAFVSSCRKTRSIVTLQLHDVSPPRNCRSPLFTNSHQRRNEPWSLSCHRNRFTICELRRKFACCIFVLHRRHSKHCDSNRPSDVSSIEI